ncbi:hypothetical protein FRB96_000818 [Tulasnella sp. 330]|nr:hypothetical protein FRB96_000818 [Tulasnella sp. 330]KAG8887948.1 hypothetical protein FRB98_008706 [Tulasnella sp. 332]
MIRIDQLVPEAEETTNGRKIVLELRPFATGGSADVYRGTWTKPGVSSMVVAVKVLRVSGLEEDQTADLDEVFSRINNSLAREVYSWQKADHRRITPMYGYMGINNGLTGERPLLVSPYYKNKNLRSYLRRTPDANKLDLLYQAAEGLNYLHSCQPFPIAHLDVKTENILITDGGKACISDFGLARVLDDQSTGLTTASPGFTLAFASPEVLRGEKGQTASDVFSFGNLILEVDIDTPTFNF